MTQSYVHTTSQKQLKEELDRLLSEGWRVIPGSFQVQACEGVPNENTPKRFIKANGMAVDRHFFALLERDPNSSVGGP